MGEVIHRDRQLFLPKKAGRRFRLNDGGPIEVMTAEVQECECVWVASDRNSRDRVRGDQVCDGDQARRTGLALVVGKVLDFWMLNSDGSTDYGNGLMWKLSDCPRQPKERRFDRRKAWLSVPVIAAALNHLMETYRPAYAKPPHLPDVLELCGKQSALARS
jgi:hypothetical protein